MATQRSEATLPGRSIHSTDGMVTLAIDARGEVQCYVGYRPEAPPTDLAYFATSVGTRDPLGRRSPYFVRLDRGTLYFDSFLADNEPYRVPRDVHLSLPTGSDSSFGVRRGGARGEEDVALTQQVFGGTSEEIDVVAKAFAALIGRRSQDESLPRLTFSRTRNNRCDISNALIPREFPYIAFAESTADWGHVSLHGFYRVLGWTAEHPRSGLADAMESLGADPTVLTRLIHAGRVSSQPLLADRSGNLAVPDDRS